MLRDMPRGMLEAYTRGHVRGLCFKYLRQAHASGAVPGPILEAAPGVCFRRTLQRKSILKWKAPHLYIRNHLL